MEQRAQTAQQVLPALQEQMAQQVPQVQPVLPVQQD